MSHEWIAWMAVKQKSLWPNCVTFWKNAQIQFQDKHSWWDIFENLMDIWITVLRCPADTGRWPCVALTLRGAPFIIQGGGVEDFVVGKLFISHFITCLYWTVFWSKLFISRKVRPKLFITKKLHAPPPPWKSNGGPFATLEPTLFVRIWRL